MNAGQGTEVILVHGLWYGAWTLSRLAKILEIKGFKVRRFKYAATADSLETHASDLRDFARSPGIAQQHFLGHSLGGLVILRMLDDFSDVAPGRVVLLGTPLRGSVTARKIRRLPGAGLLLGEVRSVLEQGYSTLPPNRDIGMIAGSRGLGLGQLTGGTGGPGDGTIGLSETELEGLKNRLVLPVTHSGMLFSSKVCRQASHFLRQGRFL